MKLSNEEMKRARQLRNSNVMRELGVSSTPVVAKMKLVGVHDSTIDERMCRIKNSLRKINELMAASKTPN